MTDYESTFLRFLLLDGIDVIYWGVEFPNSMVVVVQSGENPDVHVYQDLDATLDAHPDLVPHWV